MEKMKWEDLTPEERKFFNEIEATETPAGVQMPALDPEKPKASEGVFAPKGDERDFFAAPPDGFPQTPPLPAEAPSQAQSVGTPAVSIQMQDQGTALLGNDPVELLRLILTTLQTLPRDIAEELKKG